METGTASQTKAGWRIREFKADTGLSASLIYELIAAGELESVKVGKARIITTPPREFLSRRRRQAA